MSLNGRKRGFGALNFPLITCVFIGTEIGIGMHRTYTVSTECHSLLFLLVHTTPSVPKRHQFPLNPHFCNCVCLPPSPVIQQSARRSIKWVRFFLLTSLFLFFNQISVSCCSFSFFFIAQTSTETLEAHYNIPTTPTLFLFIKAIYFFPFLFLLNLTGRL